MDVPDELLRPGLEVAFAIAVVGARQRPPLPPPSALRPYLRFQKLPGTALGVVRKVVEEDEDFRARAASVATEELVGRPSWLWLHRPEDWQAALGALVEEAQAANGDQPGDRTAKHRAAKRLEVVERNVRRLTAELEVLRREVSRAQDARDRAEQDAGRARSRAEELERAAARARERAERSSGEIEEARRAAAVAREETEALQTRLEELEAAIAATPSPLAEPSPVVPVPGGAVLPAGAQSALDGAAIAAASLAASLQDLAASFGPGPDAAAPAAAPSPCGPTVVAHSTVLPARRLALRMPRGLHAGSVEADAWLLTEAGAVVIVDGYNVAKLGWPDQMLAHQRDGLLDLVDDLACRYGTRLEVVFDGADVGPVRAGRRRRVAVRFSPAEVPADDVIRDIVAAHPAVEPVVVVTNDRAIVHDVRAAGANVVSSEHLLAIARR